MVIKDFQIDQPHLMFKVSLKSSIRDNIGSYKEDFSIGYKTHAVAMSAVKRKEYA